MTNKQQRLYQDITDKLLDAGCRINKAGVDAIYDLFMVQHQALLTDLLDKGPEHIPRDPSDTDNEYFYGEGNNQANTEWRNLITKMRDES